MKNDDVLVSDDRNMTPEERQEVAAIEAHNQSGRIDLMHMIHAVERERDDLLALLAEGLRLYERGSANDCGLLYGDLGQAFWDKVRAEVQQETE